MDSSLSAQSNGLSEQVHDCPGVTNRPRLGSVSRWMTMVLFLTRSAVDPLGKASPAGHSSEDSCSSAQLPREACRGHPRDGVRPVPVCAGVGPAEPGTRPPAVVGGPPTLPVVPGLALSWRTLRTAPLPWPWREKGQARLPGPGEKGVCRRNRSPNAQNQEQGLHQHFYSQQQ